MEISMTKPVKVQAKTLSLCIKVRDQFTGHILDQDGESLKECDGYVPDFMPGDHHGDYLMLDIDLDSGQITNWPKLSAEKIEAFINASESD